MESKTSAHLLCLIVRKLEQSSVVALREDLLK